MSIYADRCTNGKSHNPSSPCRLSFTELLFKAGIPDHDPWPVPSYNFHDARGTECLFEDEQKGIRFQAILCISALRLVYVTAQLPRRWVKWLPYFSPPSTMGQHYGLFLKSQFDPKKGKCFPMVTSEQPILSFCPSMGLTINVVKG